MLAACMQGGVPVAQYNDYVVRDATTQAEFTATALDVTGENDQPTAYLLDVGATCANALNETLHIQLRRVHFSGSRR